MRKYAKSQKDSTTECSRLGEKQFFTYLYLICHNTFPDSVSKVMAILLEMKPPRPGVLHRC